MLYDSRVDFEAIRKAISASEYGRECRESGFRTIFHCFAAGACLAGALWLWIGESDELWAILVFAASMIFGVSGIRSILRHERCCQLYDREYFLQCLKKSESFDDLGASGFPDLKHFDITERSRSRNTQKNLTYHEFNLQ